MRQAFFVQEKSFLSMWSMHILWRTSILSIKDKSQPFWYPHSIRNWTEENKIEKIKIYRGRDRINLVDDLDLFYDGNFLSENISCLELISYFGLKPNLAMIYPIKFGLWKILKWKEEKLCKPSISSKHFQIKSLTSSVQVTQIFTNMRMYKEQRFTSHSKKI